MKVTVKYWYPRASGGMILELYEFRTYGIKTHGQQKSGYRRLTYYMYGRRKDLIVVFETVLFTHNDRRNWTKFGARPRRVVVAHQPSYNIPPFRARCPDCHTTRSF